MAGPKEKEVKRKGKVVLWRDFVVVVVFGKGKGEGGDFGGVVEVVVV